MVARSCAVCIHEKRDLIDEAIVSGQSYRDIARQYDISKDTVYRHAQNHVPEVLRKAHAIKEAGRADALLDRVEALIAEAEGLLTYGKDEKQAKAWASGISELRKCLELLARVSGLDERPQINFTTLPEWIEIRTVILTAVEPYPELRGKVIDAINGAAN
jgi:transposase-like protein